MRHPQFRQNARRYGDDARSFNERIEVNLAQRSNVLFERQTANAHGDFRRHFCVPRKHLLYDLRRRIIEILENGARHFWQKPADVDLAVFAGEILKVDLDRFAIVRRHLLDCFDVFLLLMLIFEVAQKALESANRKWL